MGLLKLVGSGSALGENYEGNHVYTQAPPTTDTTLLGIGTSVSLRIIGIRESKSTISVCNVDFKTLLAKRGKLQLKFT